MPESFVAGRYHVRKFLGEGGKSGSSWRTTHCSTGTSPSPDQDGRPRRDRPRADHARGAGDATDGAHPHVVTIFEIGEEGGAPYVVTELLGDGDVEGMLQKADGTVSLARALQVAKDVCDGLEFAHAQGIVHRDLKPGNVCSVTMDSPG